MKNKTTNAAPKGGRRSVKWTAKPCDWEGVKIIETRRERCGDDYVTHEPEQVASVSMATPEALALMLAAPALIDALLFAEEALLRLHEQENEHSGEAHDLSWRLDAIASAIEEAADTAPWEAADAFDKEGEA